MRALFRFFHLVLAFGTVVLPLSTLSMAIDDGLARLKYPKHVISGTVCADLLGSVFPPWKVVERMRDFKMPSVSPKYWNLKGAFSNRLNGRIPRQFYLDTFISESGSKTSLRVAQGSYGAFTMHYPKQDEKLLDYFVDPIGWVTFGIFETSSGLAVRVNELELRSHYNRTMKFPDRFKPESDFIQHDGTTVLVIGRDENRSKLYQLDLTAHKNPDRDNPVAEFGNLHLVLDSKEQLHSSFDYSPEHRLLATIENSGKNSRLVLHKTSTGKANAIRLKSAPLRYSIPELSSVQILSSRYVLGVTEASSTLHLVGPNSNIHLPGKFVKNPRLGAKSAYFDPQRKVIYYLVENDGKVSLAKYELKNENFTIMSLAKESVVEFEMAKDGHVIYITQGNDFASDQAFSLEALNVYDPASSKTRLLSSGQGPYSSLQSSDQIGELTAKLKGKTISSWGNEPTLSNGFTISPNGKKIIFSEFHADFKSKDIVKKSTREWFGASLANVKEAKSLAVTHGFSWIFPSEDFYSAALVTRADVSSLKRQSQMELTRVDKNSDHRILYIGNPTDAGHFMGGFAPDWKELY